MCRCVDDIREDAKHDLISGKIKFIFVVDLYNEGVDIPQINAELFHWQSQSQDREKSGKNQRYIHHKELGGHISLFVREYKKTGAYTSSYVFIGNADHVSHEGEKPVSFVWILHTPMPAELLPKANRK